MVKWVYYSGYSNVCGEVGIYENMTEALLAQLYVMVQIIFLTVDQLCSLP